MKNWCRIKIVSVFLGILIVFWGCTKHPFDQGEIAGGNREIRGRLMLSDQADPDGIYVWLEGLNISTFTDRDGKFTLTLPQPDLQGTPGGASGVYTLYFYIANYKLATVKAVIRNGEFLYSEGDFDADGDMNYPRSLKKILNVMTSVEPDTVMSDYEGILFVHVTLQALFDSVTVVFPKIVAGYPGALLFKRLSDAAIYVDIPDSTDNTISVLRIGQESFDLYMAYNMFPGKLPVGRYEIIPYFLVEQQNMPLGLLQSLSPNAQALGPEYLKIPFKRTGGFFQVFQNL